MWFKLLGPTLINSDESEKVLILDVQTRWPSTYNMLKPALLFRSAVNDFSRWFSEGLNGVRLSDQDWNAIELVSSWLEEFAEVTALMSSTSDVTISSVILLFHGLFEKLEEAICHTPSPYSNTGKRWAYKSSSKVGKVP
ncbi:hypothetical protein BT69DRAFT_474691 [Atractiella rhizophila]|nr:hypothetical protein BT69DRAFT_474691 [Atractiella rhizophila]